MKKTYIICAGLAAILFTTNLFAQTPASPKTETKPNKNDPGVKADQFVAALNLADTAKASRVKTVILTHMIAVRDWHNSHSYNLVPEGADPINGKVYTQLQRQFIIDSTIPKTVHDALMAGLKQDLTEDQIAVILDKYTIGKLEFTMNGYKAILPDMSPADEAFIMKELKEAREEAVDYKDVKNEMSTIFKIHKTHVEDYIYSSGRNWKTIYKSYVDKVIAAKKAGKGTSEPVEN
ncbi:DUF3826 domain-containing protein [Mucilaginibacter sp.]